MVENYDVVIVGGGLAGLTAALHLAQTGHSVMVCEKQPYPHHKVCGEYVSNEVLPYLKRLGINWETSRAVSINTLQLTTANGKSLTGRLGLGGMGISRYALDHMLYRAARSKGIPFTFGQVIAIDYKDDLFSIKMSSGESWYAKVVIGAFGKRSNLDKQLQRPFMQRKSQWLGVKAHYEWDEFPEHQVSLHLFDGGYGGLSKTETGAVNFCYLASYRSFKKENDVHNFNRKVVARNPFLGEFLKKAKPLFQEPLAIAQVSFDKKEPIKNHVIMCGDTAGLIHPLCGNGMAMAIHSAKLASEQVHRYLTDHHCTRNQMERTYAALWKRQFGYRIWVGRQLQSILLHTRLSAMALTLVGTSPWLLQTLIKQTHGSPIE